MYVSVFFSSFLSVALFPPPVPQSFTTYLLWYHVAPMVPCISPLTTPWGGRNCHHHELWRPPVILFFIPHLSKNRISKGPHGQFLILLLRGRHNLIEEGLPITTFAARIDHGIHGRKEILRVFTGGRKLGCKNHVFCIIPLFSLFFFFSRGYFVTRRSKLKDTVRVKRGARVGHVRNIRVVFWDFFVLSPPHSPPFPHSPFLNAPLLNLLSQP